MPIPPLPPAAPTRPGMVDALDAPAVPVTHLLYLHGFRSSPQSMKAKKMAAVMAARFPDVAWWCPQLPPSPRDAMALLTAGIAGWPAAGVDGTAASIAVVGSSLGGFYATSVAERRCCRAVLINPAVDPARDLAAYIGEQTTWQNPAERFFFEPHFVDELRALHTGPLADPARYQAFIAQGDEVLDWREMAARYAGAELHVLEGGDHALSDFDDHLPAMLRFLGLTPGPGEAHAPARPAR